jgi:hypothetical protein
MLTDLLATSVKVLEAGKVGGLPGLAVDSEGLSVFRGPADLVEPVEDDVVPELKRPVVARDSDTLACDVEVRQSGALVWKVLVAETVARIPFHRLVDIGSESITLEDEI